MAAHDADILVFMDGDGADDNDPDNKLLPEFAYTGVRATGRQAGNYLFAGPRWMGDIPKGISKVFDAETEFVGTLTRTQLMGPDDLAAMKAVQDSYRLIPLSQFMGKPAPAPAPAPAPSKTSAKPTGNWSKTCCNCWRPSGWTTPCFGVD